MPLFKKKKDTDYNSIKNNRQLGLEIKLPGCKEFVPLGKWQYNRIYEDDLGPRLLIIVDEVAELLEPTGIKTLEGKEEDAMKQEIVGLIKSITQLGRSAGIHMVLATQRNDAPLPDFQLTEVIRGDEICSVRWENLQIGDTFLDFSKCTNIGQWTYEECYDLKIKHSLGARKLIASKSHLLKMFIYDKKGILINKQFEKSRLARERVYEKDSSWVTVEDIYEAFNKGYNIKTHEGHKLTYIKLYMNGEKQRVRCIQTDTGVYEINGFLNHNSIIPGVIQNNPISLGTKLRVLRNIENE